MITSTRAAHAYLKRDKTYWRRSMRGRVRLMNNPSIGWGPNLVQANQQFLTPSHTKLWSACGACQFGGCFFLQRDFAKSRDPHLVINTLAFRLAHFHPDITAGIKAAMKRTQMLVSLFLSDRLIVGPIEPVKTFVKPILIVIDDLDALNTKD
jgi:hypothetical protein